LADLEAQVANLTEAIARELRSATALLRGCGFIVMMLFA